MINPSVFLSSCSGGPLPPYEESSTGQGGAGGSNGAGGAGGKPPAPQYQDKSVFTATPCGDQGFIPDLDPSMGLCTNYTTNTHALFRWDAASANATENLTDLSNPPDQVLQTSNGEFLVTVHNNPGLTWINADVTNQAHYPFGPVAVSGQGSEGTPVNLIDPTFPKGLVEINGRVFVATSNLDLNTFEHLPGTILIFNPDTKAFEEHIVTQGYNPTSVAEHGGLLFVVSSGAHNGGEPSTESYLEIYSPYSQANYERLGSIDLGKSAAGLNGEIAITPDGNKAVIPTADNSNRVLIVDLANHEVQEVSLPTSNELNLLASVNITPDSTYAFVGNFNDGLLYVIDLESAALVGDPIVADENLSDAAGISDGVLVHGLQLYLGVGPDILEISFTQ